MATVVYDVIPTLPVVKAHLIADCVLVFLTWVAVALRVTARKISGVGLGWDDYLILASLVRVYLSAYSVWYIRMFNVLTP